MSCGTRLAAITFTLAGPAAAGGFNGGAHSGGMMGKIVDDENAARLSFHVHSAAHTLEAGKRAGDLRRGDAASLRDDRRRNSVQDIMPTRRRESELAECLLFMRKAKLHAVLND